MEGQVDLRSLLQTFSLMPMALPRGGRSFEHLWYNKHVSIVSFFESSSRELLQAMDHCMESYRPRAGRFEWRKEKVHSIHLKSCYADPGHQILVPARDLGDTNLTEHIKSRASSGSSAG